MLSAGAEGNTVVLLQKTPASPRWPISFDLFRQLTKCWTSWAVSGWGGGWMSDGLLWSCDLLGGGGNTLPIASSLFQLILSTAGLSLCYPLVFRCPWRGGIILFWGVFLCLWEPLQVGQYVMWLWMCYFNDIHVIISFFCIWNNLFSLPETNFFNIIAGEPCQRSSKLPVFKLGYSCDLFMVY